MNKIAAYGTLRKGFYNFNRFDLNYIKTTTLTGYELYDLGPYPMAIKTDNSEDTIVVDILECDDNTKRIIDMMEIGAGYKKENVVVDEEDCTIYLFNKIVGNKIKSGDYANKLG